MTLINRITTWANIDQLQAAALNNEFNNIINAWNNTDSGSISWTNLSISGTLAVTGASTFSSAVTITPVTNQIVLGTTHTTTISSTAPAASRTYTIPDALAGANFVLDQGAYTIAGSWTFTPAVIFSSLTASTALASDASKNLVSSSTTASELGFVHGVTSAIQTQLNLLAPKASPSFTGTVTIPNTGLLIGGNQDYPTLQFVQGTLTSLFSTTSSTYQATGLTATITPKFSTSKIKITMSSTIYNSNAGAAGAILTIKRGSTDLGNGANGFSKNGVTGIVPISVVYYDSPSTTSATQYQVYLKNDDNATTVNLDRDASLSVILLEEIAQ